MELDCDQDNPSAVFLKNGALLDDLPDEISKGSFFVQDEKYVAEWSMIRPQNIDVECNALYAYVCNKESDISDSIQKLSDRKNIYGSNEVRIWILSKEQIKELSFTYPVLFGKAPSIRLVGGIKLPSEDMPCWMKGAGPLMERQNLPQEQDSVWLETISKDVKPPHIIKIADQELIS